MGGEFRYTFEKRHVEDNNLKLRLRLSPLDSLDGVSEVKVGYKRNGDWLPDSNVESCSQEGCSATIEVPINSETKYVSVRGDVTVINDAVGIPNPGQITP